MKFIRDSFLLAGKDMLIYFKDPVGLVVGFLLPIALVTVFGTLMKYAFGGSSGTPKITMHVVDLDQTTSSGSLTKTLAQSSTLSVKMFTPQIADPEARIRKMIREGDTHHGLIIMEGYEADIESGTLPTLRMLRDPGRQMEDQIIQFAILQSFATLGDQRLILAATRNLFEQQGLTAPQLEQLNERFVGTGTLIQRFFNAQVDESKSRSPVPPDEATPRNMDDVASKADTAESNDSVAPTTATDPVAMIRQVLPIESEDISPPDRNQKISYQQAQSISGMSVMMLLFGLVGAGTVMLKEREEGTLRRMFSLPIARESVLTGKWLSTAMIGLVQLIVLFAYGEFLFRVGLFSQPFTLAILIVTWVAVATSFAMMLATTCHSSKQAEGLSTILILVMSALGGCWFPTQLMTLPSWLEAATKLVPTYWAMTGFQGMMWNSLSWQSPKLIQAIGIQWLFVVGLAVISVVMFRRRYCRDLG